jgi:hypothetical protein
MMISLDISDDLRDMRVQSGGSSVRAKPIGKDGDHGALAATQSIPLLMFGDGKVRILCVYFNSRCYCCPVGPITIELSDDLKKIKRVLAGGKSVRSKSVGKDEDHGGISGADCILLLSFTGGDAAYSCCYFNGRCYCF